MNIYQKLLTIQKEVIGLGKDKSGNSYMYVTGSKVLEHIKPLMNKHGLILKQEILSIENTRQDYRAGITDQRPDGKPKSEILSKVLMRFTWIDCETGEKDENLFGANGQNDWEKGLGSALTYAERYFLLKYFHIATDEDDIDNPDRVKPEPPQQPAPQQPAPQQQAPEKPYLNILNKDGSPLEPKHAEVKAYFETGGSLEKIKDKYRLSKSTEDYITKTFLNNGK